MCDYVGYLVDRRGELSDPTWPPLAGVGGSVRGLLVRGAGGDRAGGGHRQNQRAGE